MRCSNKFVIYFTCCAWLASCVISDDTVCINNCSGHGQCEKYSCICDPGYHGVDCGTSYSAGELVRPVLTVGSFNLTAKSFRKAMKKNSLMLVGYSSRVCASCGRAEDEYALLVDHLNALKVRCMHFPSRCLKLI